MTQYANYYSSSDVSVLIEAPSGDSGEPVLLDKLRTIAFSESLSASPVYGVNQNRFGFISSGNLLVSGYLEINFIHPLYLKTVIQHVSQKSLFAQEQSARDILFNSSIEELQSSDAFRRNKLNNSLSKNPAGIDTFPEGFNLRIIFNNGNIYKNDDENKQIVIEYVKITGSQLTSSVSLDGNISASYQFLARQIS